MKRAALLAGAASFLAATAQAAEPSKLVLKALVKFPEVPAGQEFVVEEFYDRPLHIRYETELDPTTFRATLNGKDVTRLFDPKAVARRNLVVLPLSPGRNILRIEANSQAAAADPKSVLLPQEHVLSIRSGAASETSGVQAFATMERVTTAPSLRPR